jgi:hypothetical protein
VTLVPPSTEVAARLRRCRRLPVAPAALGALLLVLALAAGTAGSAGARPIATTGPDTVRSSRAAFPPASFQTAIMDPTVFSGPNVVLGLRRARSAGARAVRLVLFWASVAPASGSTRRPPNFDATDPDHPGYTWLDFDRQVRYAVARGLEPIVTIVSAPRWAEGAVDGEPGTRQPHPRELALFATAAARRYSGGFGSNPRVRYWQVWNEPNLVLFLNPQSPSLYRRMVNETAAAVKSVHADNLVIAGGLGPFGYPGAAVPPLQFMRDLLCLSKQLTRTCQDTIRFDVWSHHPYTQGGPSHRATRTDDASLGDLAEMGRVLRAGERLGTVQSGGRARYWVTEFSWDSSPPDPKAVPTALHARWVAEALYRMWKAGVTLVTWFSLRDDPLRESQFQSGLWYVDGSGFQLTRPKPALQAFRFPFVAFRSGKHVQVWGRAPTTRPLAVVVEQRAGARWKRLAGLRTRADGIFTGRIATALSGPLRARAPAAGISVPFTLGPTRNIEVWPFGCGGVLPCS